MCFGPSLRIAVGCRLDPRGRDVIQCCIAAEGNTVVGGSSVHCPLYRMIPKLIGQIEICLAFNCKIIFIEKEFNSRPPIMIPGHFRVKS